MGSVAFRSLSGPPRCQELGTRPADNGIGHLCIGVFLGVGPAFYGTTWVGWIDIGWIIGVWTLLAIGSLAAIAPAWRRAKNGEPIGPIYLHHLLPDLLPTKAKRWMLGKNKMVTSH